MCKDLRAPLHGLPLASNMEYCSLHSKTTWFRVEGRLMFDKIVQRATFSGLGIVAVYALLFAFGLSLLHHTDHALRVDHSGWPFRSQVTPFTYSLLAYPVILFALFGAKRLYWIRWTFLAAAAGFVIFAHTFIENPSAQFTMWAHNHSVHYGGISNAFEVKSPVLGVTAVVLSMVLNLTAAASAVLMFIDGRHNAI